MKKLSPYILSLAMCLTGAAAHAELTADQQLAKRNVERAMAIIDATWNKAAIVKSNTDIAICDVFDINVDDKSGPSDVWPYTAAIEAHCSLLEAMNALERVDDAETQQWVAQLKPYYTSQLDKIIDNLEWYRGTYNLPSYAVISKSVSPYAVPRASRRGGADVSGILNVYDDQMWIARELIRAYKLTDNRSYLDRAVYLTDYALEGWDCWHDGDGKEYGGITWGPGYNSKHACSNAPIIQPLVWLSDIYADLEANDALTDGEKAYRFYDRDEANKVYVVKDNATPRSERYLQFARKVYDWQKDNLYSTDKKVFWDMMGADNTIKVQGGYRQHVDCGGPTGSFISYNTGTMISGAAELYRTTGDEALINDLGNYISGSIRQFGVESGRNGGSYEFNTDTKATEGFLTWFNDVLIRSFVDGLPYAEAAGVNPERYLAYHQTNLDTAFEKYNVGNLLPIHLRTGWGSEVKTKPFHQYSFASEYAILAKRLLPADNTSSVADVTVAPFDENPEVYTLSGVHIGAYSSVADSLPNGLYIVGNKKVYIKR
ncbi:MAG: hypothetical protein HDS54_04045 [Barnesiella sp.]|nr:hypothetical protein [Barnesiella sp.]